MTKTFLRVADDVELSEIDKAYEEAKKGPRFFIDDGCVYFDHSYRKNHLRDGTWLKAWVTLSFHLEEFEGGPEFTVDWHCRGPHPDHFLSYLQDMYGPLAIFAWGGLCHDPGLKDIEFFMLSEGIAPEQRFVVELLFSASRDYWGEYDEELDGRVLDIEPWPHEQIVAAWDEYVAVIYRGESHGSV